MNMISKVKLMTEEKDETVIKSYLDIAAEIILNRVYPFRVLDEEPSPEVPMKYQMKQVEITCFLMNKRGAEGETSHNENGINRSYENAYVPDSMLKDILPVAVPLGERNEVP